MNAPPPGSPVYDIDDVNDRHNEIIFEDKEQNSMVKENSNNEENEHKPKIRNDDLNDNPPIHKIVAGGITDEETKYNSQRSNWGRNQ